MKKTKQQNEGTHSMKNGYNRWPFKGAQQTAQNHRNLLEDGLSMSWKTPQVNILTTWPWVFLIQSFNGRQEVFLIDYFALPPLCTSTPLLLYSLLRS